MWKMDAINEGKTKGFEQGRQEGLKYGLKQGVKRGLKQGIQEGVAQGLKQGIEQQKAEDEKLIAQKDIENIRLSKEITELKEKIAFLMQNIQN